MEKETKLKGVVERLEGELAGVRIQLKIAQTQQQKAQQERYFLEKSMQAAESLMRCYGAYDDEMTLHQNIGRLCCESGYKLRKDVETITTDDDGACDASQRA